MVRNIQHKRSWSWHKYGLQKPVLGLEEVKNNNGSLWKKFADRRPALIARAYKLANKREETISNKLVVTGEQLKPLS